MLFNIAWVIIIGIIYERYITYYIASLFVSLNWSLNGERCIWALIAGASFEGGWGGRRPPPPRKKKTRMKEKEKREKRKERKKERREL